VVALIGKFSSATSRSVPASDPSSRGSHVSLRTPSQSVRSDVPQPRPLRGRERNVVERVAEVEHPVDSHAVAADLPGHVGQQEPRRAHARRRRRRGRLRPVTRGEQGEQGEQQGEASHRPRL
jgi:hypothetical protein